MENYWTNQKEMTKQFLEGRLELIRKEKYSVDDYEAALEIAIKVLEENIKRDETLAKM